jgi:large subunit ribosomal protein L15
MKRGFTNIRKLYYKAINVDQLANRFEAGETVDPAALVQSGLIKKDSDLFVVLGRGDITIPLQVQADRVSESAKAKIEAAGGSVEIIQR